MTKLQIVVNFVQLSCNTSVSTSDLYSATHDSRVMQKFGQQSTDWQSEPSNVYLATKFGDTVSFSLPAGFVPSLQSLNTHHQGCGPFPCQEFFFEEFDLVS